MSIIDKHLRLAKGPLARSSGAEKPSQSTTSDGLPAIQKLAQERISFFEKALKDKGYYVRTGVELEFTGKGKDGRGSADLDITRVLNDLKQSPFVESVVQSGRTAKNPFLFTLFGDQYEVVLGRGMGLKDNLPSSNPHFSPSVMARATYSLKSIIDDKVGEYNIASASFAAKETSLSTPSDMHINMSLCNKEGLNLFSNDAELTKKTAYMLKEIQSQCTLAFEPHKESYKRTRLMSYSFRSTPLLTNVSIRKKRIAGILPVSVCIRDSSNPRFTISQYFDNKTTVETPDESRRIENRLAGADADPFVAMAATLGAFYFVICESEKADAIVAESSHQSPLLPQNLKSAVQRMDGSVLANELFGDELNKALLNQAKAELHSAFHRH